MANPNPDPNPHPNQGTGVALNDVASLHNLVTVVEI